MRRYLTLVCLFCLAIPAGVSISGCTRNPGENYCNGLGYGPKITDVSKITLQPATTGISIAYGQTRQISTPSATTCKDSSASVSSYIYGTTNNQLVDVSPTGNICAGTWNRNTGGGIADYTVCNAPTTTPTTGGLPYTTAYVTASADSVTSNPVEVYVHQQVSSITLVGPSSCLSQTAQAQLDAQACYTSGGKQYLLCAPSTVTKYACPVPTGVTSVPSCTDAIGALSYNVGTTAIASINNSTNVLTALEPGTTAIQASVAGSGSSAGYVSVCPPASIKLTMPNGATTATVTQGATQTLLTTAVDTAGHTLNMSGLTYESTDPADITVGQSGSITATLPSQATLTAICAPPACNPAPTNQIGVSGTGLPISSNPVTITVPGTASQYVWYAAPGASQYFSQVEMLNGTVGTPVKLPYVPNSMGMDKLATTLYFGSANELMIVSTSSNSVTKQDVTAPGVVVAVSPDNSAVLINDTARGLLYIYNQAGGITVSQQGMVTAAQWSADSKTLYAVDTTASGAGHSNTLYVYNANTSWSTYDLTSETGGSKAVAVLQPSVGAYLGGSTGKSTTAHTWCPTGPVANYAQTSFYPLGDTVSSVAADALATTTDGAHVLAAALSGGAITLNDIGVTIPTTACQISNGTMTALTISHTLNTPQTLTVQATAVTGVVASPAQPLAFVTYTGTTTGAKLPYYQASTGTLNYLSLTGTGITAPVAGAFSQDNKLFFVSTSGDNQIHYVSIPTMTDTQQISPNLPSCTATDAGCSYTGTSTVVPATAIAVKPRATT